MITIYWSNSPRSSLEHLRADPPVPIINKILKNRTTDGEGAIGYNRCPAFIDELTNTYGIKSIYDYEMYWNGDEIFTQFSKKLPSTIEFFEKHVRIRSKPERLFGSDLHGGCVFFTEIPSLIISQLPAFMEDNTIVKNTICIPGQFDIGKYFRPLDFAWHLKEGCNEIKFSRNEIAFYVKFHTKEKIKFQRFFWSDELTKLHAPMSQIKFHKEPEIVTKALKFYYNVFDKFKFKKRMLKIIKENLCKEEDLEGNVI